MCTDKCGRCADIGFRCHGSLFGMKVIPRKDCSPLIELYIEDDGLWHYKCSFDSAWLKELIYVSGMVSRGIEDDT